jgi:hypothetical protein
LVAAHAPKAQQVGGQTLPQLPQLLLSQYGPVQEPLQIMSPETIHWQVPFWQIVLPRSGQMLPQLPQLLGSVFVFVQYPQQVISPLGHWLVPFWQVIPLVQPHCAQ